MIKKIAAVLTGDTCKSVGAFLADYVEGRLEPKTAQRFESHIEMCPNCKRYLDQYRETIALVSEIPATDVPPELEERTCAFIHNALGLDPELLS